MRWNLLLVVGMGLLASLAALPQGASTEALQEKYDRGFNEGFQCATRQALEAAEARSLGEYFYDDVNQRHSFRWFCDEARRREAAGRSAAVPEQLPRRVSQLSLDSDLRDEFLPRRRAG